MKSSLETFGHSVVSHGIMQFGHIQIRHESSVSLFRLTKRIRVHDTGVYGTIVNYHDRLKGPLVENHLQYLW